MEDTLVKTEQIPTKIWHYEVFAVHLNTPMYSRKSLRYSIYKETKVGCLQEECIWTWCMYMVELLEITYNIFPAAYGIQNT